MSRKLMAALVTALLFGIVPAGATHGGPHPVFSSQRVWFKCVGDATNRLQNMDTPTPWDRNPPSASVQSGAGCGFVDSGVLTSAEGEAFDPVYAGEVVGNVRNMTVELHVFPHSNWTPVYGTAWVGVGLVIDGDQVLSASDAHEIALEEANSGATQRLTFTITGLDGRWVEHEDGVGTTPHTVELTVTNLDETEVGTWVWDTTEVPSGITFNDAAPAGYVIQG